jgi:arsenite/tail-anchored protein-transporting ATPase
MSVSMSNADDTPNNPMSGIMQDLAFSIPGVDEAMNFAEVMKQVNSMEYSVIIFDTAPTGHTLRFLSFPTVLEKALAKVSQLSSRFGPMMNQMSGLLGVQQGGTDDLFQKLEGMRETVKLVNEQFQYVSRKKSSNDRDPEKTTFICVMIAEFLSLWETERMIQELATYHIDTHNIVINFLVQDKGK